MRRIVGLGLFMLGLAGLALGQNGNGNGYGKGNGNGQGKGNGNYVAPEIDPSRAVSALALLSGSVLVLRRRN